MRQNSLLIGLGGTGSRVVNAVAERLNKENVLFNNDNIGCIVYDTNRQDTESIISTGAGVPVIKISTDWTVQEYFRRYEDKMNMSEWCPLSPAFMATGMNDGASEVRIKSRIAFMHTLEDATVMKRIEDIINRILDASGNNLRIMIVTSVAGGTGAGMFLQMALWLRKHMAKRPASYTVRGIFMMPEIFSNTLDNIRNNDEKIQQHRANAYASIKELNFINGVMYGKIQNYPERIVIENMFDSEVDANKGKQLFDYAFLVDHLGKDGTYLNTFDDYINYVRDMVFMQLYEPLTQNLYSDEDNLFRQFIRAQEPLFGACGTSKAIYPKDNVLHTFELRCMKKMLSDGWEYLDTEIEARKKELEEREAAGETVPKINEEELFVELYDQELERNKNQGRAGKLFQNIIHDTQNEKYVDDDGVNVVQYSDKAEDYLAVLDQMLEDSIKASSKKMSKLALAFSGGDKGAGEMKTALEREISDYVKAAEKNEKIFTKEIDGFKESGVASCAYEIIRKVFPLHADNKGEHDGKSVCSVLTKMVHKDGDRREFIHPLAMRYVLYKLKLGIMEKQKGLHVDDQEEDARDTNYPDIFDNKKTKRIKEQTALAYLNSKKGLFQSEKSFKEFFLKGYQSYLGTRMNMIAAYEKQALEGKVYSDLLQYLSELIKQLEQFFKNLSGISEGLEEELKSVMEQCKTSSKTMYVYATPEAKNKMFEKLQVDFGHSDAQVNASIINAVYGSVCATFRPDFKANKDYIDVDIKESFADDLRQACRKQLISKLNKDVWDLSFYDAMKNEAVSKNQPVREVLIDYKNKLLRKALPSIMYTERSGQQELTLWGLNPLVTGENGDVAQVLGINFGRDANEAYSTNELQCYRSTYGLSINDLPMLSEKGGEYFEAYKTSLDEMQKMLLEASNEVHVENALVLTPHLNKTWHSKLPMVSEQAQKEEAASFYEGFWLALAYGKVKLNKEGNFQKEIETVTSTGRKSRVLTDVIYDGEPVDKLDVLHLLDALKHDLDFSGRIVPAAKEKFEAELKKLVNYVDTTVFKGLTKKRRELNAVDMVIGYNEDGGSDAKTTNELISALELIAAQMAANKNIKRSGKKEQEAMYRICKGFYDSATRTQGKEETFAAWVEYFSTMKGEKAPAAKKTTKSKTGTKKTTKSKAAKEE